MAGNSAKSGGNARAMATSAPASAQLTPSDTGMGVLLAHKRFLQTSAAKRHHKQHKPTIELSVAIERAVGLGMTQAQVSYLTGLSQPALRRNYRNELDMGGAVLQSAIGSTLAAIALDPSDKRSVDAAKFILSRRFGWTEKTEVDLNANVTANQTVLDVRTLSPEDRGQLRELLAQALSAAPALSDGRVVEAEFEDVDEAESAEDLL